MATGEPLGMLWQGGLCLRLYLIYDRSFEQFILAVNSVKSGKSTAASFDSDINAESISLASIGSTYCTTAILEAGRRSLDKAEGESKEVRILYEDFLYPLRPTSLA